MARGGYKMVEERLLRDDLAALEQASKEDPSIVVSAPTPPPRHRKWKEGRKRKGKYITDGVAAIASRIVSSSI